MGIDKDKSLSADAAELRRQAEKLLCAKTAELHPPRTEEAMQRLDHEFEVHQIELELQNEELRQARIRAHEVLVLDEPQGRDQNAADGAVEEDALHESDAVYCPG